ncbi:hypothetical protein GQ53DRAFT_778610 [Thozetella sp. PMI_491]|nr:hypothetical protein GQ53DRAFT_778610 [Thozetella sp. PMI_491]
MSAGRIATSILHALRPEILQPHRPGGHRSLARTAWLDGLRGWAALIVCWVHLSVTSHHDLEYCNGYEVSPGVPRTSPAMWPFVRVFFSGGQFSVTIFFTISGYVLSRKLIGLLHEERIDDFVEVIQSAIFRRPIRLILPVASSTLAWLTAWHVFDLTAAGRERQSNIFAELGVWLLDTADFAHVLGREMRFSKYNLHTWTIPVEMRGSMLLFVWLFAFHQVNHRVRIYATITMMLYLVFFTQGVWYASFLAGMLFAEAGLLASESSTLHLRFPWDRPVRALTSRPRLYSAILHLLLVTGLWLGSVPADQSMDMKKTFPFCPIWNPYRALLPPAYGFFSYRWFWFFWGAGMIITAAQGLNWLRGFFEWRFSQYLGRISFTLYLIHGYLISVISEPLFWLTGVYSRQDPTEIESALDLFHLNNKWADLPFWPFRDVGPYGLEPNFFFCAFTSLIFFLYLAELGTRVFDTPSVKAANWVYTRLHALT